MNASLIKTGRRRAPSKRAIETRMRVFDAAETLFAANGYDGTSLRDIASMAGATVALVHFHGVSKEALFRSVVERRAHEIARARETALRNLSTPTLRQILGACLEPVVTRCTRDPEPWANYVRLIAHVSSDPRWSAISTACFDPTARQFIAAIGALFPQAPEARISRAYVFAISAMLAHCTAEWRVAALCCGAETGTLDELLDFVEAGMARMLAQAPRPQAV